MKNFFTHWKTTLLGILIASLNIYASGADNKTIAISAAVGLLGAIAKDPSSKTTAE